MSRGSSDMTEAELATSYNETRDLSGFDAGTVEPVEVRRNVTISVRFSEDEIGQLRELAEGAGMKVTAFIRAAALHAAAPVDRLQLLALLQEASADVARAEQLLRMSP
jgi:uncharacterized protein (DUF1778 family)